ncbi:hypothetical protein FRC04_005927 [Tulasnella sp. 424]|nr:hypothetical protein FRC04_005927 [Tulasnella sp. 424]
MLRFPLLDSQSLKNVAKVSTTVRTLLSYIIKVLEEMRKAWFGTESLEGGRDVGRKWIKVLEEQERAFEGATSKTNPIWELTNLLFTGKTSGAMREFLGGHGKLSERGMAQWEATVQGSLTILQESAERRISPACERLIIVLEEVRGWAVWSQQYAAYMFSRAEIDESLALCHRAIELSEWLSKTAEIEFERFHEFMRWMKAETSRVTDGVVGDLRPPTYDPLEVSEYLDHGLLSSSLDKWFLGPMPQLNPSEAVRPSIPRSMADLLAEVNTVVDEEGEDPWRPSQSSFDSPFPPGLSQVHAPLEDLDRNLLALANELAVKCAAVFDRAAGATGRQAIVECSAKSASPKSSRLSMTPPPVPSEESKILFRDRLIIGSSDDGDDKNSEMEGEPSRTGYCVFECRAEEGNSGDEDQGFSSHELEVLDLAFFDDDTLLMVTRTIEPGLDETVLGRAFLVSVPYSEASYKDIRREGTSSLEELADAALQLEQLSPNPLPVNRARALNCCSTGATATLAVNGRENRRCACVVEESGQLGEIFDIDAEGDDDEDEEEDGEEGGSQAEKEEADGMEE